MTPSNHSASRARTDLHVRPRLLDRGCQQPHRLQTGQVENGREAAELGHRLFDIAPGILAGGQQGQLINPLATRQEGRQPDPSKHLLCTQHEGRTTRRHTAARRGSRGDDRCAASSPPCIRSRERAGDDPGGQVARHGIQQGYAERVDVGARLGPHIEPEIVSGHDCRFRGVLGREVSVCYRNNAGHGSGSRQYAYLLRLELLVPQRMSGSSADPMEPQVAIVPNLRHGITGTIERARDDAMRRARADRRDDVARRVGDPTVERGGKSGRNPPLVTGNGVDRHPRCNCLEISISDLRRQRGRHQGVEPDAEREGADCERNPATTAHGLLT